MTIANRTVLHFGSYWMGENDIVNLMQRSLARMPEMNTIACDMKLYAQTPSPFVIQAEDVNWIRDDYLDILVKAYRPGGIICTAGGLSPSPAMHTYLASQNIVRIGIALSDPDDFPRRSQHFAHFFDSFYTNAVESLASYQAIGVDAKLLPFAADPTFHRPLASSKKYDIIVVGGKRADRVPLVEALQNARLRVKCYGRGWRGPWLTRFGLSSEVHGADHVAALNSGTVYLSFAATNAGFTNVKVGIFEAAACGACILVQDFPEIQRYFEPDQEIVTYTSEANAVEKARVLCAHPQKASQIGARARQRILAEHTWEHRWHTVLSGGFAHSNKGTLPQDSEA